MAVFKIPKSLAKEAVYEYMQKQYIHKLISYALNSREREATKLMWWQKKQIDQALVDIHNYVDLSSISKKKEYDYVVMDVLSYVKNHVTYKRDNNATKPDSIRAREYWQTYKETLNLKNGDCEDGAILTYILCRCLGVPANRLMLFAGLVKNPRTQKEEGHCYLMYRPSEYPLNWVMLDWCYYPSLTPVEYRNKFYVNDKTLFEFERVDKGYQRTEGKYRELWFCFNEQFSNTRLELLPS